MNKSNTGKNWNLYSSFTNIHVVSSYKKGGFFVEEMEIHHFDGKNMSVTLETSSTPLG